MMFGSFAATLALLWWMRKVPTPTRWLLSLWSSRGEIAEVPEDFDTQPRTSDRDEWDSHTADAVLLTHEKRDDEENDKTAADFLLWDAEVGERSGVHKYMRRMDRWSQ